MSDRSFEETTLIQSMPKSALQALYHAVTGKTENLSKRLKGSVVISYHDFQQLHDKLRQQAEHYNIIAQPTVTIVVKQEDSRSLQYSSWERFKEFQQNASDVTSEVSIKMEFLIQIPNTPAPQRFIISVGLDSGLPVIYSQMKKDIEEEFAGFFIYLASDYPTVEISIDFVDYLIAKIFSGVVEEWFSGLQKLHNSKAVSYVLKRLNILHSAINQIGRVGTAIFIASYAYFNSNTEMSQKNIAYALAICILLWSLLAITVSYTNSSVTKKLSRSMIPSIILFTDGDKKAYDLTSKNRTSLRHAGAVLLLTSLLSVILNVLSSYVYAALVKP